MVGWRFTHRPTARGTNNIRNTQFPRHRNFSSHLRVNRQSGERFPICFLHGRQPHLNAHVVERRTLHAPDGRTGVGVKWQFFKHCQMSVFSADSRQRMWRVVGCCPFRSAHSNTNKYRSLSGLPRFNQLQEN